MDWLFALGSGIWKWVGRLFHVGTSVADAQRIALLEARNTELEKKVAEYESWAKTEDKYQPCTSPYGFHYFLLKGSTPPVYACAHCMHLKKERWLQPNGSIAGDYRCRGCSEIVRIVREPRHLDHTRPQYGTADYP